MKKVKLWKTTVNGWGWDRPLDIYGPSRDAVIKKAEKYPAWDRVQYAGAFTPERAALILNPATVYKMDQFNMTVKEALGCEPVEYLEKIGVTV